MEAAEPSFKSLEQSNKQTETKNEEKGESDTKILPQTYMLSCIELNGKIRPLTASEIKILEE